MSDEEALSLVAKQGFGQPKDFGPKAPTTVKALLTYIQTARKRGFSMINEVFAPSMTAMAAPVLSPTGAIGVVTIAGPLVRLTEARMEELAEALKATADEIRLASGGTEGAVPINPSPYCKRATYPTCTGGPGGPKGPYGLGVTRWTICPFANTS